MVRQILPGECVKHDLGVVRFFMKSVRKSEKKYFARKFYQLLRHVIDSPHENRLKRGRKNSRDFRTVI